jgi:hypothetical protein
MKRKISLVLLIIVILTFVGCAYLYRNQINLKILINHDRDNLEKSSLAVFNFKEPGYAKDSGREAAGCIHGLLLASKKIKLVRLNNASSWTRMGVTEEGRIKTAIQQAGELNCSYILIGEITKYLYGGINRVEIRLKVRIIEISTQKTVFYAKNALFETSQEQSYPLDTKLVKQAKNIRNLMNKALAQIVKKI